MVKRLLDVPDGEKRSHLGMECPSTSVPTLFPGLHSSVGGVCLRSSAGRGHRKNVVHSVPGSAVFCPEERHGQEKGYSGPVNPEQIHSLPYLQDDNGTGCEKYSAGRRFCDFYRFKGRVLACPYCETFSQIPGVSDRKSKIQIQGYALRSQCGSSCVHQTLQTNTAGASVEGNRCSSLSGRLAGLGPDGRSVSGLYRDSPTDPGEKGLYHKLRKVKVSSQSVVRVAGDFVEHLDLVSYDSFGQGQVSQKGSEGLRQDKILDEETIGEINGQTPICLTSRPLGQGITEVHKPSPAPVCKMSQERLGGPLSQISQKITEEMVETGNSFGSSSFSSSSTDLGRIHRRVPRGMGCTFLGRSPSSGDLVINSSGLSHKYSRAGGSLPSSKEPSHSPEYSHKASFGQLYCGQLSESHGLCPVSTSQCLDYKHSSSTAIPSLGGFSLPYCRSTQCYSGRVVETQTSLLRMDHGSVDIPESLPGDVLAADRPVCDEGKSPGPSLRLSSSGRVSSGHRCIPGELGNLGQDLPVSPVSDDFKSHQCIGQFQREGSLDHSKLAKPSVVPAFDGQVTGQADSSSPFISESRRADYLLLIKQSKNIGMLDFLKSVYSDAFSLGSAEVLVNAVRGSTANQYSSIWRSFCEFLKEKDPPSISVELVLTYLRFLFFDKGLAPNTVTSYKSALARPLKLAFDIDVSDPPFPDFIKAIFNLRPNKPASPIKWSLDRVLSFALSPRFQVDVSIKDQLVVCLFLTALATGSRASELSALLRLDKNLIFSGDGVTLYPNPNFLAKNENPRFRRDPIFISRLRLEDGGPHPLCPVEHMERFLSMTAVSKSVKFFVDPVSLQDLSVHNIRLWLCKFIKWGDPGSFPRSHDLRKVASTLAFLRSMSMDEICTVTGWSSIRVFRRHYFKKISEVASTVVLLGSEAPSVS